MKGGEAGGRKLERETVSAETLDFLKVRFNLHTSLDEQLTLMACFYFDSSNHSYLQNYQN